MSIPETLQLSSKKPPATGTFTKRQKTILRSKAPTVNLFFNDKDVTPKPLYKELFQKGKERQLTVFYSSSSAVDRPSFVSINASHPSKRQSEPATSIKFRSDYKVESVTFSIFVGSLNVFDSITTPQLLDEQEKVYLSDSTEEVTLSRAEEKMKIAPTQVSLILVETGTFFLLDIPTQIALRGTPEGDLVESQNEKYEYITSGRGRNRKVFDVEVQTNQILRKTRETLAEFRTRKNQFAFASDWDMYDTYNEIENEKETQDESDSDEIDRITQGSQSSEGLYKMSSDEKQMIKLIRKSSFLEAVCVMERLLANNIFNEQQKRFRGLLDPDDFREDIEYNYRLNLLWTFANGSTKGRCVNSIEWNPENKDLVAVGYGKFLFTELTTGVVNIWNIKNPVQPERSYNFKNSVTSLSFSRKDPNLLAIGFYNGHLIVIDIASRELNIIGENTPTFEVIWCVVWRPNMNQSKDTEQICITSDDGKVIFYTLDNGKYLQDQQMMRVSKADGKLQGYNSIRKCSNLNIPVSRYAGARVIRWHPTQDNIYLICTNEGVVHKCSTNYLSQHLDLFLAHDGPINDLKYSPFSEKIYATCGDDWYLRIWAEGIAEPLHELFVNLYSVQGMDWSPTHSTILATIHGKSIVLWDFQRKVWKSQSITYSPTQSRNTIVQFVESGRCIIVGDIDGNVHVFSLEDMPFPPYFQENQLFDALERSLTTNPSVMDKVKRLRQNYQEG